MVEQQSSEGDGRRLLKLFFPLLLVTFSNCLFLFVEKLLLARFSAQDMQAAVNVSYVCQIFQVPCIALVMMAQVLVGRSVGANQREAIGPAIWQFIWFSLLSLFLTVPATIVYGHIYFQGTEVEKIAYPYFYLSLGMNFLHPLGAALSCFYIGRGKTRLILLVTIGSQLVKLILGYVLIFGWGPIPRIGLVGGPVSTLIAQSGFCLALFLIFLNREHRAAFSTNLWHFNLKLFWASIYPGFLRGLGRISSFACWASIAHLMAARGGNYLQALSVGGTLSLFFPFLSEAMFQAQTTIVSQLLGGNRFDAIKKAARSGYLLALMISLVAFIPLVLFPHHTFYALFPKLSFDVAMIRPLFFGFFLSFFWSNIAFIPISTVLAFKDMNFSLFIGFFNWINGFLLMYFFIEKVQIPAERFYLALSLMHISVAAFYILRSRWLSNKISQDALVQVS